MKITDLNSSPSESVVVPLFVDTGWVPGLSDSKGYLLLLDEEEEELL